MEKYVVATTASRPWLVVCGKLIEQTEDQVTLEDVRCAVYYSPDTRSVLGLASHGPSESCRISRSTPRIVVRYETILEATPEAVEAWQAEPW